MSAVHMKKYALQRKKMELKIALAKFYLSLHH